MKHSPAYLLGLACGIFVAAMVLVFVRRRIYGKAFGRSDETFDERQQLARGEAYKAAFFAAMGWMVVGALVRDLLDTSVQMTLGICLSVGVFALVCIKKDAYLSLRDKPKSCIRWFLTLALINLVPFAINLVQGKAIIENGIVTHRTTNLIVAVLLLVVSVAVVLRQREIRRELAEETEEA